MFTVNPKKTSTKDILEDNIKEFKKNEEAVYDMLALYQFLLDEGNMKSFIGVTLLEKVIKDLEDPEVTVSYKARTVNEFYHKADGYPILRELRNYKNIEGCKELYDSFYESYKRDYTFNQIHNMPWNKPFNLIIEIAKNDNAYGDWTYEFLISDIPLETRLEMFMDVLNSEQFYKIRDFLTKKEKSNLNRTNKEKIEEKRKELVAAIKNNKEVSKTIGNYLISQIKNRNFGLIKSLQDTVFDFNSYIFKDFYQIGYESSAIVPIVWFSREKKVDDFKILYESDSYKNIPENIRNNDDYVAIEYLSMDEIIEFIKLRNFRITPENLVLIINKFRNYYKQDINSTYKYMKTQIIDAIIRKAKNKEEYKQMLEYVKYFVANTDFEKEELDELQKQQLLQNARTNLSTVLYNLNEQLQETEPGRKLLKNINFKQNN